MLARRVLATLVRAGGSACICFTNSVGHSVVQAVVFQITQHFDNLAAELGLEDGGKAPATGGEGDM